MLTSYIRAAMRQARYEMIADEKPFYGHIPECPGVWASGRTLEECRDELQETLEEWLSLGLRLSPDLLARILRDGGVSREEWDGGVSREEWDSTQ